MGLGLVHFFLHKAGKNDFWEPLLFSGILVMLLGARWSARGRQAP